VSQRDHPYSFPGREGFLGDLRRPVVADNRRERGDHGKTLLHHGFTALFGCLFRLPLWMHLSVNALTTLALNSIASSRRKAMIGIITFSSKLPACPHRVRVASESITSAVTWSTDSFNALAISVVGSKGG
jgi:hypothetical protein